MHGISTSRALLSQESRCAFESLSLVLRNFIIVGRGLLHTVIVGVPAITALYWNRERWTIEERRRFIWSVAHNKWAPKLLEIARVEMKVLGLEKADLTLRQYIVAPNHTSMLEIFAMIALIPDGVTVAKIEASKWPILGQAIRWSGQIIVDRANHSQAMGAVRKAEDSISSHVLVYPEGTRTRDGELGSFKHGAAFLAKSRGFPVLPVAITGGYESLPKGNPIHLVRRPRLTVEFGHPINPSAFENRSIPELTFWIRTRVSQMIESQKGKASH